MCFLEKKGGSSQGGNDDDVIRGKVMMALILIKGMACEDRDA